MTTTFYILHGDDDLSIDEAVGKIRAKDADDPNAGLNTSEFDGSSATVPEIINAVTSYPFLSDRRMVIVKGLIGWITRKGAGQIGKDAVARLNDELPNLPDYARLILVERGAIKDNNAVMKVAKGLKNGKVQAFSAPKDPTSWIIDRARNAYEMRIDNRAAVALSAVIGDDLRRADNELVKLVNYVGVEDRSITEDDVAALTPYVPEANIFKMVDAIAEGRGELALDLMHRLLADKKQDPFGLYGMIVRQFRLLLLTKEYLVSGGASGGIASAVGVRPFVAQNLARQARGFSLADLETIYRSLAETDLKMKTGRIDPALALDLFVASIAR